MGNTLPAIPAKRYFTIGEVGELCGVKPHVLRYWEQEFTQLRPMKRRGNRRYYQHHEVLMIRRIRELLYDQGFTISGARQQLQEMAQQQDKDADQPQEAPLAGAPPAPAKPPAVDANKAATAAAQGGSNRLLKWDSLARELREIRELLSFQVTTSRGRGAL
ncbi:MAG: MerR family transcriptional regulator [Burkholderiaceae bacterium]|jgi:DNA-binding transcriptional MerR regulator|nr:MerR family transcriptional regulator [Burkholderiaceae bacterium]